MSNAQEKRLFIIDGSSFLYRAYYGLRPLNTPTGEPIQAVYGFCRMIKKLMDKCKPDHMVLVWDSKGKTARHELFPAYKSTRQAPPSDLFTQKEYIVEFAQAIGLCQLAQPGVEADDLMYSLGVWWQKMGGDVVVITSDKDMGQMIGPRAILYDFFKDTFVDDQAFQEKMGFPVSRTAFYFSLLGDTSDAIPGVKGIGAKRALELVQQFESLEDLYTNIHRVVQPGVRKALESHKQDAYLSEKLFTLVDYPLATTPQECVFDAAGWSKARPLFEKLGFKSLLSEMKAQAQEKPLAQLSSDKGYDFQLITTRDQIATLAVLLRAAGLFAYDTETDGLNPLLAKFVGVSVCTQEGTAYYIPCGHTTQEAQLSLADITDTLGPIFADPTIKKVAHHAKFDQLVLFHNGITVHGLVFDTLVAAALVKDEWQKSSLKDLSIQYFNEPMLTFKEMVTDHKRKDFSEVPLQEATEYAAADAHQTFKLYAPLSKALEENNLQRLYYDIEMPVLQVLCGMEARGIYCDAILLQELGVLVDAKLDDLYKKILVFVGPEQEEINLNSPKQVAHLLFEQLQLIPQKKSAKGTGYATDNEVLVELSKVHPVAALLIQYRELYKLKSTYIEALPAYINPETGCIHTTYSQIRVATGRLASSDPNMQNIPVDGLGSMVRAAFCAQEGHLFLSVDYSQIELRVLAYLSKDEILLKAFQNNEDIHAQTAAALFGVAPEAVTKAERNLGKRINFSVLYGLTPYGLSKDLSISLKDAKKYIDGYFKHYPRVREWMDSVIEKTKELGYVQTVYGRRRPIPAIHERNKNLFEEACRVAVNTVVQGTAAEIMKIGMVRVERVLEQLPYDAALLLQIHDELLLTVPEQHIEEVKALVVKELENVVAWDVTLTVDTAVGKDWKEVG